MKPRIGFVLYPMPADAGIARGYFTTQFAVHRELKRLLGDRLVDGPKKGGAHPRVNLHICPPHQFSPTRGKINVLLSMWETPRLPPDMLAHLRRADAHVVPSHFCRSTWIDHGLKDTKVVGLGAFEAFSMVDPARRTLETADRQLRVVWVGSKTKRKGWQLLAPAWQRVFDGAPKPPILTVKTIGDGSVTKRFRDTIVIDQRDLDPEEMLKLYLENDIVLSTSFGEGFGLPVLEGMATGCLAIAPLAGGMSEYIANSTAVVIEPGEVRRMRYGIDVDLPVPTVDTIAAALDYATKRWGTPEVEARRQRGCQRARSFTWESTATAIAEACWNAEPLRAAS